MFKKLLIQPFAQFKGLPLSVYILAGQRFINSMGHFVYPFLAFFMSSRLGLNEEKIGLWLFILATSSTIGSFISGFIVDKFPRKLILISSVTLSALLVGSGAFINPSMYTIYILIISSFIKSFARTSTNAILADVTDPSNRKQSISLGYLLMNGGLAIGFTLAGLLYNEYWRFLFVGDALTSLLSIIPVIIFVKESKPTQEDIDKINSSDRVHEKEVKGNIVQILLQRPFFLSFILINSLIFFAYRQQGFITPLQLEELFTIELGAKYYGAIMTLNTILVIFFTPLIISLTNNIKPILNIIIATILYILGFGMMAYVDKMHLFYVSTFIWTIGEIIATTNVGVYTTNHMPINHRGKFTSFIEIMGSASTSLAPLIMGSYLLTHSKSEGWILTVGIVAVATIGLTFLAIIEHRNKIHN